MESVGGDCVEGSRLRAGLRRARFSFTAFATLLSANALAQPPAIPPQAPTREEVERPLPYRQEPAGTRLRVEDQIERAPCSLDQPEYQDVRFSLNEVAFEGLREVSPEALRAAYASLLGQTLPISAICEIRDRAAAILNQVGYVVAVEVPEQRITEGRIRFNVIMARLVGLTVRGDAGRAERLIASYLERLTDREVFNRNDAERYLLLAGDVPGYNVRLALRNAGRARGEVIGEVSIARIPALGRRCDPELWLARTRPLGRTGAGAVLRSHRPWRSHCLHVVLDCRLP